METKTIDGKTLALVISKENFCSESDFKNSNGYAFLIANIKSGEKIENSKVYQMAVKILHSIQISSEFKNEKNYFISRSPNLMQCSSKEEAVAGHSILLYLDNKNRKKDTPKFFKKMYLSVINSLTGKDSHVEVEKDDIEEIVDICELMNDQSVGKFVQ